MRRQILQCENARCRGGKPLGEVYCAKGHQFPPKVYDKVAHGKELTLIACLRCPDYDRMGDVVDKEDRGWL